MKNSIKEIKCAVIIGEYINGNYKVSIYSDGTKIRENNLEFLIPSKPEAIDMKITDCCDIGCPYCHENSLPNGLHGDILNAKFIDTLLPYTEVAIGGGNPLSHPGLVEFLHVLKDKSVIANITINQKHFLEKHELIQDMLNDKLLYGVGVSLTNICPELISLLRECPNAVVHVINGVVPIEDLTTLFDLNLKILILGFKEFRRGSQYYSRQTKTNKALLYEFLPQILEHFQVISFDNLAVKQLDVKRLLSAQDWKEFYMGDDGSFTMYIDMVKKEFARSSISNKRFKLLDDIEEMFSIVREQSKQNNKEN